MQKKITKHQEKLPVRERERIEMDEIGEKRKELQRFKKDLWRHRGYNRREKKVDKVEEKGENRRMREKLEKILAAKEMIQEEEKLEREKKQKIEEHLQNLRNKKRLEEMTRREEQEKRKDRLEKKRKKEGCYNIFRHL